MKNFTIGSRVTVHQIAELKYVNNKRVVEITAVKPFNGAIIGKAIRYLGDYQHGGPEDEPYLGVKDTIILWQVRASMTSTPVLVHDSDLTRDPNYGSDDLPFRASKPKRLFANNAC